MANTLIVNCDGTWLNDKDARPSNVRKYHNVLSPRNQLALYLPGVGAERGQSLIGKWLGGAFGLGAHGLRNRAYKWICSYWIPGDKICFSAFSRGSAVARMAAAYISKKGIKYQSKIYFPSIDFLGCWDTVASFGIPINLGPIPFQRINLFSNLEVGQNVKNAVHIVALDENREGFMPSLMNNRPGINEIWAIGTHSDVGGGEPDPGLSDITLSYMMREAQKVGVKFKDDAFDNLAPNPDGTIHAHRFNPKPGVRTVHVLKNDAVSGLSPKVHVSATTRQNYKSLSKVDMERIQIVP